MNLLKEEQRYNLKYQVQILVKILDVSVLHYSYSSITKIQTLIPKHKRH